MLTIAGAFFLLAAVYAYYRSAQALFSLLLFSSLFPATALIGAGSRWIPPYYVVACFFIARSFLNKPADDSISSFNGKYALIAFGCIGVFSAIVLPLVFAGIPVYSPQVGIDDGAFYRPPLHLGLGNIGQACYLVINIFVVLAASKSRICASKTTRGYWNSCFFLMGIVFLEKICDTAGVQFPYSIILNTPISIQEIDSWGGRMPGTFSEPSTAGIVLAGCIVGLLSQLFSRNYRIIALLFALLAFGLVESTASLAGVVVGFVLLILRRPVFRPPWYLHVGRMKSLLLILTVLGLSGIAIIVSPIGSSILEHTLNKQDSVSFINRIAADQYAVELVKRTNGIGVGLGSNRPSSLLTSLLSNVGVLGLVVFAVMCIRLLSNTTDEYIWIRWATCAVIIDMLAGGPDITAPVLWILLAMSVWFGVQTPRKSQEVLDAAPATPGT
jgi:hypothetical protein